MEKKKKNEADRLHHNRAINIGIILGIMLIFSCLLLTNAFVQVGLAQFEMTSTIIDMTETKQRFDLEVDMTETGIVAQIVRTNIFRTQQSMMTGTARP
jgi:hypothetical protein